MRSVLSEREIELVKRISAYISAIGLTKNEVADKAKISPRAFNSILQGRRKVSAIEYFMICSALEVDLDEFYPKLESELS
jgi:Helix-turn-helix.